MEAGGLLLVQRSALLAFLPFSLISGVYSGSIVGGRRVDPRFPWGCFSARFQQSHSSWWIFKKSFVQVKDILPLRLLERTLFLPDGSCLSGVGRGTGGSGTPPLGTGLKWGFGGGFVVATFIRRRILKRERNFLSGTENENQLF